MIRKGIVIDTLKFEIVNEVEYDDQLIDGFYVRDVNKSSKEGANLLFAAFVFPVESKPQVEMALKDLKEAKKTFEDIQARIFYKMFPRLRKKV